MEKFRIEEAFATFENLMLVTLTIDPKPWIERYGLEHYQEAMFRHVQERRSLWRVMDELDKGGFLASRRYVWVFECQRNGNAHWHLVVDAGFNRELVNAVRVAWDKQAPAWLRRELDRVNDYGFGRIDLNDGSRLK
ncbi:MAG: hypothetical protein WBF93_11220, partial [Pirellulales bacterium]